MAYIVVANYALLQNIGLEFRNFYFNSHIFYLPVSLKGSTKSLFTFISPSFFFLKVGISFLYHETLSCFRKKCVLMGG